MDPAFQNAVVQLGCAGLLLGFMYLRLKKADDQGEAKDKIIEKLQSALVELSTETAKSLSEMKVLLAMRELNK